VAVFSLFEGVISFAGNVTAGLVESNGGLDQNTVPGSAPGATTTVLSLQG